MVMKIDVRRRRRSGVQGGRRDARCELYLLFHLPLRLSIVFDGPSEQQRSNINIESSVLYQLYHKSFWSGNSIFPISMRQLRHIIERYSAFVLFELSASQSLTKWLLIGQRG
jgi:hypothetical protein